MYPPFNPYGFIRREHESHHWHGGSAFRTQYFNALSMSFPEAERRMIQDVRAVREALGDCPQLHALQGPAKEFIAQEASHSAIHARLNVQLVNPNWPVILNLWPKRPILRRHWLSELARTCAFEHLTTLLSVYLFRRPDLFNHVAPDIREFWVRHAAEEIEHRCLALDLYRAAGGGYLRRIQHFFLIVVAANALLVAQTLMNLALDGQLLNLRTWRDVFQLFFSRHGLAWFYLRHLPVYMRPDFNPKNHHPQECDAALRWLRDYRGRTPGRGLEGPGARDGTPAHNKDPDLV